MAVENAEPGPDVEESPAMIELGRNVMEAARNGDVTTLTHLISFNAPFVSDWLGLTAMHYAAAEGHLEIVKILITAGNLKDMKSKVGKTALHMACQEGHADVAKFLISQGASVQSTDMFRMTPLHWATERGHEETVSVLLQNAAPLDTIDKFNRSCHRIAHANNHFAIFSLLQRGIFVGPHTIVRRPLVEKRVRTAEAEAEAESAEHHAEAWSVLDQDGIEMLADEDEGTLVANALDRGHRVVLTEAGRQALHLTVVGSPSKQLPAVIPPKPPDAELIKELLRYRTAKQRLKQCKQIIGDKMEELENSRRDYRAQRKEVLRSYIQLQKLQQEKSQPLNIIFTDSGTDDDD